MFGYVTANKNALSADELARYKSCYCGLCRTLRSRHGRACRFVLHYDMVFLAMTLASLYEPEETQTSQCCPAHPLHAQQMVSNRVFDYAADMNVALAYHNCRDDWKDEHRPLRLMQARMLRRPYGQIAQEYPRQCESMERCMQELAAIEEQGNPDPDAAAGCFGRLMGELFVWQEDRWASTLRAMGSDLGCFVYIMDAVLDLESDRRHGRYNPFATAEYAQMQRDDFRGILTMLIGECTAEFDRLPLVQDAGILRNILYSGVWQRFELVSARREKKGRGGHDT